ncbi:hypothetical protein FGG08_002976 [Glutinoglossum americanum]|uniref:Senescence domain-containing protein n=1 Tax=Glutinoglossum americanum TaxID=1670608 RepID=A0A9P8I869_9PEZI|nr:hypothetical protein FGG08_002976 [Glutinoglossum americanum]
MSGHNDPRLLYSIPNIRAYHLQNGAESSLTGSGPQTLSLLMVPTSSPFADLPNANPQNEAPEEDFYLHLNLPPELDLPLPATTQIYHQPPNSYLIPRWDLGPDSGAFTRIEFPGVGTEPGQVSQEDIDTFETILAQCTAFLERAPPPIAAGYGGEKGGKGFSAPPQYNPADYAPGEGYAPYGGGNSGGADPDTIPHGHIVLIDEENGSVVGELSEGFHVVEDPNLKAGSKNPVEIQLPSDSTSNRINVRQVSPQYAQERLHPAYASSSLVTGAVTASRLIVTTSGMIGNALQSGADTFTQKVKPAPKPMTFTPTTHARVRKLHNISQSAAVMSSKTVGQVTKYAQNVGAAVAHRGQRTSKGVKDGKPVEGYKPGILNKSLIAFSTIADGVDQASRNLLASSSIAATAVVGHRYGEEAREVARGVSGGFKNVGLVYVDATGVSRKAVIKSVAKGMVVGRVKGSGDLVVGGSDGGIVTGIPEHWEKKDQARSHTPSDGRRTPGYGEPAGYAGPAQPPAYGTPGVGEPLHGPPMDGYFAGGAKH